LRFLYLSDLLNVIVGIESPKVIDWNAKVVESNTVILVHASVEDF